MSIEDWLRYHQEKLHFKQSYRGLQMIKNPFDLIVYEEILWEVKPTIIIEIGTSQGGFTLWLRDRMKMIGAENKIITVDLDSAGNNNLRESLSDRFISLVGDCNSPEIIEQIKSNITPQDIVLVIEDSSHTYENTLKVLDNYKSIVTIDSYLIVEDGICDVLNLEIVPGPMKAVESWIVKNPNFEIDRGRERYIMTYNPKGYLKRVS